MRKHTSPVKAAKQALKRKERNTGYKSAVATETKKALATIATGDKAAAQKALRDVQSLIDGAKTKNIMHHRTVARKVSRVAAKVAKMAK